jgi:signal transduction histidine kinase
MAELLEERIKSSIIPSSVKVIANLPESQDVNLDSTMISRVIDNLIRNAVEAMPKGGTLTINASVDGNILKIIVQDSGVGINEENKLNLFQPFYTTKRSGTGLGLYYSKLAVESHGGKMSFNSEEGIGTRFHLEIPLI